MRWPGCFRSVRTREYLKAGFEGLDAAVDHEWQELALGNADRTDLLAMVGVADIEGHCFRESRRLVVIFVGVGDDDSLA